MGGKFSLAAWKANNWQVIDLSPELAVKVKNGDVLAMITNRGDMPNPLMELIQRNMQVGQIDPDELAKVIPTDPNYLVNLRGQLNEVLVKVIIEPPLIEQGNADGISIDDITLEWKMDIFSKLLGGDEQIEQAKRFLQKQGSSVVAAPA